MLTLALMFACVPKKDFDALTAELAAERASAASAREEWGQAKADLEGGLAAEVAKLEALKAVEAGLRADLAAKEA